MRTCKWCGKQFDYSPFSRGSRSTEYCCGRCYNAAMHEEQRERQRNKEAAEKFEKDHPLLSSILEIFVIGFIAVAIIIGIVGKRGNHEERTIEEAQEAVVTQSASKEKSDAQTVKLSDIEINRETENLQMHNNIVIDAIEEDFAEGSDIEVLDEEIVEDHEIAIVEKEDFSKQRIYDIVEEKPSYPDGDLKLMEYIAQNINYPQEALESGIQGRVFVSFVVEPNGSITNEKVLRGIGYGCDEEAIRVVKTMPKWIPGKRKGKPVRVSVTIPVKFMFQ